MNYIRSLFPIFTEYPTLAYLDNAATTQKPNSVIDAIAEYYRKYNANAHRGLYKLADISTTKYEEARAAVAKFINAEPEEIIFTAGATESINIIALSLQKSKLISDGPKILLTDFEHHSNLVPWQELSGSQLSFIEVGEDYQLQNPSLASPLDKGEENPDLSGLVGFDVVAFPYVSNVTGTILTVEELVKEQKDSFTVIDASQAVGHMQIDVKKLNCDFLAFSAHKMYGPQGIGVLFVKKEILQKMEPVLTGGGMIREVTKQKASWSSIPNAFEAGTPNIAGAVGLQAAINLINEVGWNKIIEIENHLHTYTLSHLHTVPGIKLHHPINHSASGVISFSIDGIHPHDIAQYLGEQDICIRAGNHCAQPLHKALQADSTARISLGIYNSEEEVERCVLNIKEAIQVFKK